jgi:sortase (surface protein transpeptidase)
LLASYKATPFIQKPILVQASTQPIYKQQTAKLIISGIPSQILIPSRSIDLHLEEGKYIPENKSWTLNDTGAHYAITSSPANDFGGTTFLYGHNNKLGFGPILGMSPGEIATVVTENNLTFTYKLERTDRLNPEDTTILENTSTPRLVLQTCSGNWNEHRQVYIFKLIKVNQTESEVS